jgi:uncharacterized membrane protein
MITLPGSLFFICLGLLIVLACVVQQSYSMLIKARQLSSDEDLLNEPMNELGILRILLWSAALIMVLGYPVYQFVIYNGWEAHVMDWLHLIVRWFHIIIGIAWIGASFYFTFLENSLNRVENLRPELAGDLWALHGGGFYYLEKYKGAPKLLPKTLHWFKYEAYFTWVSGIVLLFLVYYINADAIMLDPAISSISGPHAILLGIGSLLISWVIYDFLCNTRLLYKNTAFALVGFGILTGIAYYLSTQFSGRAAFMHLGALLGTIMVGNVFFVIIPAQKALVKAAKQNLPINFERNKIAGLRSLHNNYITFPVLFIMISNHFPTTFGNSVNWLVFAILTVGSVAVKHYINLHEKGRNVSWLIVAGALALIGVIGLTAPESKRSTNNQAVVSFAQVQPIFQKHCISCHSANPTDDVYKVAPAGVMYDTPDQIRKVADKILIRAVQTKTMPQGNKTGMTDAERETLGVWISQGAKLDQ